jgi:fatty-acyl-CoA synthase
VYSHRSTWLHSMASMTANSIGLCERDRLLLIVPMFHVNAWGAAYTAFFAGVELIMPQMFLQGEPIVTMIRDLRPTISLGVPTIWNDVLRVAENNAQSDFSSLRAIVAGGSAVPRIMIETFRERHHIDVIQGWGMTETSPLAAVSIPPSGTRADQEIDYRSKAGRVVAGVEVRVTADDGTVQANDGKTVGEFEIRGPWITGSYFGVDDPEKFRDGWLRTGDIGTLDGEGFMMISDRTKDVIKSGGEWISSVELESTMMAHPAVFEAAVIAVPDERWAERPLCCVVFRPGESATIEELRDFLSQRVAAARTMGLHRDRSKDQRWQIRQKGIASAVRRPRARRSGDRLVESLTLLADEISNIESRVADAIFTTLREQLRGEGADEAKELERRLSKVRRSLQKAEMLLRGSSDD